MANEELYFGFASNLSSRRMKERGARFVNREAASLSGYRLVFNVNWSNDGFGYANIEQDANSTVHGALYTCEPGSLDKLDVDHVERGHFKRVSLEVKRANGETVEAVAFMANKEFLMEGLKPNIAYVSEILEGEDVVPPDYYAFLKSFGETQK